MSENAIEEEEVKEIYKWREVKPPDHPHQLVMWSGSFITEEDVETGKLDEWFKQAFPTMAHPIISVGCVQTLPNLEDREDDEPRTGGRSDFFFIMNAEDVGSFAIARFQYGMRWWTDVMLNEIEDAQDNGVKHDAYSIYPADFRACMEVYLW